VDVGDAGTALASGGVMANQVVLGVLDRNPVDAACRLGSLDFGAGLGWLL
jgi:hypothetical protein